MVIPFFAYFKGKRRSHSDRQPYERPQR